MNEAARILTAIEDGDPRAAEQLLPLVYDELRRLAARKLKRESPGQTLQATALVHEAYMRLVGPEPDRLWDGRSHFFAAAAQAMRHILVDHARAHIAGKRGAGAVQVTLDEGQASSNENQVDILAVDEALKLLSDFDPRQARVLELHFFAGLTFDEIAAGLGISARTIKRDWMMARAWMHGQLSRQGPNQQPSSHKLTANIRRQVARPS
jgi:RNA polymerase sigma factor (TIGR02999 family)